jgi:CO/xanthine dehydrogenase Mo-binding subunit
MIKTPSIDRRQFLKVVSVAGAGLAIGFYVSPMNSRDEVADATPGIFAPNVWLRIDKSGSITVTVSKSEMGQGISTGLPMILAEELEADWTKIRFERANADTKYGNMGTGGSQSTRSLWNPLREAGAVAREMLISAAAQTWNVSRETCRAGEGTIVHVPSGRKLAYSELVEAASKLAVPENAHLKDSKDFHILGRKTHRLDTPEKVDGSAKFGIDVKVPGMLYAVVARPPVFGGSVKSVSATKAKAVPGVHHVVEISQGVAVVADSTWNAIQGRKALEIVWDEGPNANLSSAKIHTMLQEFSTRDGAVAEEQGDVSVFGKAAMKIEAVYELPYLAHATMEPMNCTADVRNNRCEIWAPTQSADGARSAVAEAIGLSQDDVVVHVTYLGGGFGRRYESDFVVEAANISKAVNAPVKVLWTRDDDMQHDWYRPTSLHHLNAGLNEKGALVAFKHRIIAPSINGQRWPQRVKGGLDHGAVEGAVDMEYEIPNSRIEYVMANTAVPVGWWRSVYASQNVFVLESFIDELASAAAKDPLEYRRQLLKKDSRMKKVLETVAEKSAWGSPLPKGRFRGIACAPPAFFGSYVAHVAEISIEGNTVRVHRVISAVDCGICVNPDSVEAQIESSIAFGTTAALKGEITIEKGRVVQGNFDDYMLLTIDEMPKVEVHNVPSSQPVGGMGEPGLPPIAPAIANAVFAATGKRIRKLPIRLA